MIGNRKIFCNGSAVYVKTDISSSLLSADCSQIDFDLPVSAHEVLGAINKLSELDNCVQLRQDAILNGKAIIANWQPPTVAQIDKIIDNMKKRLLA